MGEIGDISHASAANRGAGTGRVLLPWWLQEKKGVLNKAGKFMYLTGSTGYTATRTKKKRHTEAARQGSRVVAAATAAGR